MTNKKIDSRASQTKVKEQKKVWTPPSSLDAPPAPDGFKHRWIRAESMGFDDSSNMSAKLRSGFELVRSDEAVSSMFNELRNMHISTEETLNAAKMPDIPLSVITHGKQIWDNPMFINMEEIWLELQTKLSRSTSTATTSLFTVAVVFF